MQSNLFSKLFSTFNANESHVPAPQKTAPMELEAGQLDQVGGGGPHGGWVAAALVADGPHGGWL